MKLESWERDLCLKAAELIMTAFIWADADEDYEGLSLPHFVGPQGLGCPLTNEESNIVKQWMMYFFDITYDELI